ncbi:hypothetical protein ACP70R_011291 [Stipagrostis hirtigluma subsp. patula]
MVYFFSDGEVATGGTGDDGEMSSTGGESRKAAAFGGPWRVHTAQEAMAAMKPDPVIVGPPGRL